MDETQKLLGNAGLAGEPGGVIGLGAIALGIVIAVAFQRIGEAIVARRNSAMLKAHGWQEVGVRHYPALVMLQAGWLLACAWAGATTHSVSWGLIGVFIFLQVARLWIILSLGPFWTTRILTHAQAPLLRRGPYRYLRHPHYWIVVAEVAVLPLAFGAWEIALGFLILTAGLLLYHIRVEEAAIAGRPELR